MIKQKKGQVESLFYLGLLIMVVIVAGFVIMLGSGILTFVGNEINDVTSDLGMIGDTNMSAVSDISVGTTNNMIQMLQWGSGVLIFVSLMSIILFALTIRLNPSGYLIGFYLFMVIMFIFAAIIMSNLYESFLLGTDEIALELQNMAMGSMLVVYLPTIITVLSFIGGIIIFTGLGQE